MLKNILFFILSYILIWIIHCIIINQIPCQNVESFNWNNGEIQDKTLGNNEIHENKNIQLTEIQNNQVNKTDIDISTDNNMVEHSSLLGNGMDFENMTKELTDYTSNIELDSMAKDNSYTNTDNCINVTKDQDISNSDLNDFYKTMNIELPLSFDPVPTSKNDVALITKDDEKCMNDNWNIKTIDNSDKVQPVHETVNQSQNEISSDIMAYNDSCEYASIK